MSNINNTQFNLLIVDDVTKNIQVLGSILRQEGYSLSFATNGRQALDMLTTDPCDLILLDVMMPEMDGFEVCERLKQQPGTKEIPVIFLTAKTETESIVQGFDLGAVDYITKPFNAKELLVRVRTHLALKTAREELAQKAEENARLYLLTQEQKEAVEGTNKELQQRNRELTLLNQVGRMFSSSIELDRILATVLRSVRQLMNITSTSFWIVVPETGELVCQQAIGPKSDMVIGWRLPPGQGIVGRAAQAGQLINVTDARTDPHHYSNVDEETGIEYRSNLSIPFQSKGTVIGVLTLLDTEVGRFTDEDVRLLEPIAAAAANAVENARLYMQVQYQKEQAEALNKKLDAAYRFIRKTFGRYLSDEIVETILETPEGLQLGGEKRSVTIMMTDLRGFTAISERFPAEEIVKLVNTYFEVMTEIILKYQGTIDEFLGDAVLAIFGAPVLRNDDAIRAVACALEMQLAMREVNRRNQEAGYPEIAMGIGINTGEVVVGNIGSSKRTKYGIVGRQVNLTSRIEAYTVGGQILISENTRNACGDLLRIDDQLEIMPKGVKHPITIYDIGGIKGDFNIFLPAKRSIELHTLQQPLHVKMFILEGKYAGKDMLDGHIVRVKDDIAEIQAQCMCRTFTNLKIVLYDEAGQEVTTDLYAKVTRQCSEDPPVFQVNLTSIPSEAERFLRRDL